MRAYFHVSHHTAEIMCVDGVAQGEQLLWLGFVAMTFSKHLLNPGANVSVESAPGMAGTCKDVGHIVRLHLRTARLHRTCRYLTTLV